MFSSLFREFISLIVYMTINERIRYFSFRPFSGNSFL